MRHLCRGMGDEKMEPTIKEIFQGERYSFQLEIHIDTISNFTIYSKYLKNNSVSTITNMNWIISEFGRILVDEDEMSNIDWESDWEIKDRTLAEKLWEETKTAFNDISFIRYLEYQLDDDRSCGEWESGYEF